MVLLSDVHASNLRIPTTLSPGLVAVFVGATNGIGELTLKKFAKYAVKPRVYFIGRSQEAGDRILAECQELNKEGIFQFIQADVSLLSAVDDVSQKIREKEKVINLLFLTAGSPKFGESMSLTFSRNPISHSLLETTEGLPFPAVLGYYARTRFIVNLLPLVRQATGLRRVVTVAAAGKEGPVNHDDLGAAYISPLSLLKVRGHFASIITLSLEVLAKQAPEVTFIHDYPGSVKTGIAREANALVVFMMGIVGAIAGSWMFIPHEESGERHLFLATSAKYPPKAGSTESHGVPLADDQIVTRGTTGEAGSGVYAVDWDCNSASLKVKQLLVQLREEGLVEKLWQHTEEEFKRITGSISI
ncbi:hypothetical protein CVT26_006474 [Gymnopilus dilepis]|uniref:Ketoreductase (KR) domain-containing protein n=1 Tax=Gymnopilus dilepis TaxID=231916 RepID=A0A409YTS2_9AGAR|nr:hypothetical protein CVT26_006474 [Gymnopilus dilepis]